MGSICVELARERGEEPEEPEANGEGEPESIRDLILRICGYDLSLCPRCGRTLFVYELAPGQDVDAFARGYFEERALALATAGQPP